MVEASTSHRQPVAPDLVEGLEVDRAPPPDCCARAVGVPGLFEGVLEVGLGGDWREIDGRAVVGPCYADEPGVVPGEVREFREDGELGWVEEVGEWGRVEWVFGVVFRGVFRVVFEAARCARGIFQREPERALVWVDVVGSIHCDNRESEDCRAALGCCKGLGDNTDLLPMHWFGYKLGSVRGPAYISRAMNMLRWGIPWNILALFGVLVVVGSLDGYIMSELKVSLFLSNALH